MLSNRERAKPLREIVRILASARFLPAYRERSATIRSNSVLAVALLPDHNAVMSFRVQSLAIPEVLLVQTDVYGDGRGFFMETWNQRAFDEALGRSVQFVQDNHSRSVADVLRGLHYQLNQPQGKLVRVARGRIFDVAVDLRTSSSTFRQWVSVELSEDTFNQLWIPPGFGHGFLVLSESADVLYKTTTFYDASSDRSVLWNDEDIGIRWPLAGRHPLLSDKDRNAKPLRDAEVFD